MNSAFRKQILREFPELAAGYHLPVMAEVEGVPDAPTKGGVNDNYRPRLAVDVVLLNHDYKQTDIRLEAVPVAILGGGDERGFFTLPKRGTVVELAWLNGLPERPFIRSVLGDRQALPWMDANTMTWQQNEETKQSVDAAGNWKRKTPGNISDSAHTIEITAQQITQELGQEVKRILEHSLEDIDGKKVIEAGAIHQLSASVLNLLALGSINQVAGEHITRSASGNIRDNAESNWDQEIGQDFTQVVGGNVVQDSAGDITQTAAGYASIIATKVHVGSSSTNALQLLVDLMGQVVTALNSLSTMTVVCASPGAPSSPPVNAAGFTTAATNINALKTQLSSITQ